MHAPPVPPAVAEGMLCAFPLATMSGAQDNLTNLAEVRVS